MTSRAGPAPTPQEPNSVPTGRRHGLTIVYTGNGKGKTTAAIGLTARAAGNRMRVCFTLAGRGAPPEVVEAADLVSEVRAIKHPYDQGIKAQRGIEF